MVEIKFSIFFLFADGRIRIRTNNNGSESGRPKKHCFVFSLPEETDIKISASLCCRYLANFILTRNRLGLNYEFLHSKTDEMF